MQTTPEASAGAIGAAHDLVIHGHEAGSLSCKQLPCSYPANAAVVLQQMPGSVGGTTIRDVLRGLIVGKGDVRRDEPQFRRDLSAESTFEQVKGDARRHVHAEQLDRDQVLGGDRVSNSGVVTAASKLLKPASGKGWQAIDVISTRIR